MHQLEEAIREKENTIRDLKKKLKEVDNDRTFYKVEYEKLLRSTNTKSDKILNDLDAYLLEFNTKLATSNERFFNDNLFECFVLKLFDLIKQHSNQQQVKSVTNDRLKKSLLDKLHTMNQTATRMRAYETKNVDLECKVEQLNLELESLKQAINCKKLYSNGELAVVCSELMKWKKEMKQLNSKVIEQNKLINLLVRKCETMKVLNEAPVTVAAATTTAISASTTQLIPIIFETHNDSSTLSTPSSSLTYETLNEASQIIEPTIMLNSNEVILQVYQCPKCNIEISNDIDFRVFTDHVENCNPKQKLVCMFCLKLFNKQTEEALFYEHVSNH